MTGRFAIRRFEKILVVCLLVEMVFRLYTFIIGSLGWSAWSAYSFTVLDSVMESLIITVSLVTLYKALVVIRRYRKRLDNNYSEKADKDLKWASELLVVLFIVTCCWMLVVPINFFFGLPISGLWILFPQALLIFYFGIKGHLQPEIFHPFPLIPSFESPKPVPELVRSGVLQNSPQAEGENAPQLALIHRALHEDKVYRKPRLTLQELAKITQINSRQLSMLINQHYQLSFSDFINQHRVEEIKERIRAGEDEKFTLLAIALEAGFNSKSSFNQMFKKFTGKTPMQFKKALTA
ncbi:MAG TPA: hypothetical protein DCP28_14980 [Cytophagales bacterium]|nr:hypothetical protein [Cytophagales bacterium]